MSTLPEHGRDAPGWCHCRTSDCPFCSPPLTADEMSGWDWQLATGALAAIVRAMGDSAIPSHVVAATHIRAVIDERIRIHADRHIVALRGLIDGHAG